MADILEVRDLDIDYRIDYRWRRAVSEFSLNVQSNQIYGIVGESGSGKSTVIQAIIRYLSKNGRISGGEILFNAEDLTRKSRRQMQKLWGNTMFMVPQNPFSSLNPSIRIGEQIAEILRVHTNLSRHEISQRVLKVLNQVRLPDPEKIMRRYPHELSGGQQQRVVLAMGFVTSPQLLLLDEPTTSLDVTTEAVILDLVRDLIEEMDTGAVYVTHNLGVVAQLCERVTVMYAGEIMEDSSVQELYAKPLHPYTIGLLASIPRFGQTKYDAPLHTIPGRPPGLGNHPLACVFADRCPVAIDICRTEKPSLETVLVNRRVRCHRWQEIASGELVVEQEYSSDLAITRREETENLLTIQNLTKHFNVRRDFVDVVTQFFDGDSTVEKIKAVNGVNLSIQRGHTLGLVGESGSGKTTLARVIIGLTNRTSGKIILKGVEIRDRVGTRRKETLKQLQMVFQNPQDSLNPYLSVGQAIKRPLLTLAGLSSSAAQQRAINLLEAVSLDASYMSRYPGELSGGEKQRVAIARAFASNPELIIADEPVSSLDVSVRSAVLNLLAHLQSEFDTAYLFISHDLADVTYLADFVAVMYLGEIFEVGYAADMGVAPMHPYTEALVSAIPVPDPRYEADEIRLRGDLPSPRNLPTGCLFHTRCPRKIGDICEQERPPWRDDGDDHFIKCHIPIDELIELQTEEA
ncbi:MAG: ABC transporter ATP-binding protein [Chloroflexi bacterium]|nr:ABC transporter ATP-binding protein [Chloroflexota bacterium]